MRNVQGASEVEADFADAGLTFGDGTLVSAGVAAEAVAVEGLNELGRGFLHVLIEDFF
jgi:hypothetical protein